MLIVPAEISGQTIGYFNNPNVAHGEIVTKEWAVDFGDSTETGTLRQHLSKEGVPVSYSRHILTSVCFDGKCRLLDINLYWTATGGYRGFELPPGEFLSKTDHDPFSEEEYRKLHEILSDSISPLADYSFEELVPGTGNPDDVDAVSSATLKDILDYIVPGAAYTTYRLWHLVYGKSPRIVSDQSSALFSRSFALALLDSGHRSEQIWALSRLPAVEDWGDEVLRKVLVLVEDSRLDVSFAALNALSGDRLEREEVQKQLLKQVAEGEYTLKKTAIGKLNDGKSLSPFVRNELLNLVNRLNGDLLDELLAVFLTHGMNGVDVQRAVSAVLEDKNRYKAGKAMGFLEKIAPGDSLVRERMEVFKGGILLNN